MSVKRKKPYTRLVLLIIVVSILNVGVYLIGSFVLRTRAEAIQAASIQLTTALPKIVQRLVIEPIESLQWYTLEPGQIVEYSPQQGGIADAALEPLAPTDIVVLDTKLGQSVVVSWQPLAGQTYDGVEVYRATAEPSSMKDMELVHTSTAPSSQWIDRSVDNDTIYYYALRSYRTQSTKLTSPLTDAYSVIPSDQTPPPPPRWVTVTPYSGTESSLENSGNVSGLEIEWERALSDDIAEYKIYRSTQAGQLGEVIQTVTPDVTIVLDTSVDPGVEYFYTVTAHDAVDNESVEKLWTSSYGNDAPFVTGDEQANAQLNDD